MAPSKCPYEDCSRILSTRYNLKKHIESHHLHIRPFKCAQCQRSFAYKHSLKHHYLQHLEIDWEYLEAVPVVVSKLTEMLGAWGNKEEKREEKREERCWLPGIGEDKQRPGPLPGFF